MYFRHSNEMWNEFPDLVAGALFVEGITADAAVADRTAKFHAIAEERLAISAEGEMLEIQAWRRTFSSWRTVRSLSSSLCSRKRRIVAMTSGAPT